MSAWRWSVEGTEVASGTMLRPLQDSGVIDAETAGDVMEWLTRHGPFWDNLDSTQPFHVRIAPNDKEM